MTNYQDKYRKRRSNRNFRGDDRQNNNYQQQRRRYTIYRNSRYAPRPQRNIPNNMRKGRPRGTVRNFIIIRRRNSQNAIQNYSQSRQRRYFKTLQHPDSTKDILIMSHFNGSEDTSTLQHPDSTKDILTMSHFNNSEDISTLHFEGSEDIMKQPRFDIIDAITNVQDL